MLRNSGIPIVEIWDFISSPLDMCVGINHFDSGFDMGRYLVGCKYRCVGYVGTSHDTATYYPRYYGAEQLLASNANIDCIFFQNDAMAFGGLQYCKLRGLDVPDDIGIAGWGDLPIASVLPRRMTSMHVPHLKLGQTAAEMMIARLSGEPVENCRGYWLQPHPRQYGP